MAPRPESSELAGPAFPGAGQMVCSITIPLGYRDNCIALPIGNQGENRRRSSRFHRKDHDGAFARRSLSSHTVDGKMRIIRLDWQEATSAMKDDEFQERASVTRWVRMCSPGA